MVICVIGSYLAGSIELSDGFSAQLLTCPIDSGVIDTGTAIMIPTDENHLGLDSFSPSCTGAIVNYQRHSDLTRELFGHDPPEQSSAITFNCGVGPAVYTRAVQLDWYKGISEYPRILLL
jgi:hypothetical protein